MNARFIVIGAVAAFLSVAIGAFGAHGLKDVLTEQMMKNYNTGVQYQMFHSTGLLIIGILNQLWGQRDARSASLLNTAGWLMLLGMVLFSGSLYTMALTGLTWLGAITPLGGVSFLAGWTCIAISAAKQEGNAR
jgi:uncharacterized membrane protein YgdD (TMEM256/DUF423 family)